MDALSDILENIKFNGMAYQKIEISSPWGFEISQDENSQFWRLLKGTCYLKVPGEELKKLEVGDLVLIPHGSAHWLANEPDGAIMSAQEFRKVRLQGTHPFNGTGNETVMIGGHFVFDSKPVHPFVKDLPKLIHITADQSNDQSWLQLTARQIYEEVSRERPGSKILIDNLSRILFIHIIRAYLEQAGNSTGFLLALQDTRISKALTLMQQSPQTAWKLDILSKAAGMSRTAFCNKFKELTGETALNYLTDWRIIKAKRILTSPPEVNISEVAYQVGYQSEASFNRIFKSKTGSTPARYRRGNK